MNETSPARNHRRPGGRAGSGGAANPVAGRRFEYKVRDDLTANGYWVMRSPASKSPVDMVAIKAGQVLFVQCKINGRLDPEPWNELHDLAYRTGARAVLAERTYHVVPTPGRYGEIVYWELVRRKHATDRRTRAGVARLFLLDEIGDGDA